MSVRLIDGAGFRHAVFEREAVPGSERLHVYIEGDGIPWNHREPNDDPTRRNTLALRLANLDDNDIAYVGRPCYFGLVDDGGCSSDYWTSHRYGEAVVASMAAVIIQLRERRHAGIVLIGHSGGGALAALLESKLTDVVAVVTIGANLDIEAWAEHHGYDPLDGSINPIDLTRKGSIPHLQLIGALDQNVPPSTVRRYAETQPGVEARVFDEFDHVCCWEERWPALIGAFEAKLTDRR